MNTPTDFSTATLIWSQSTPTQPGYYWYWDGKEGNAPTPFQIVDLRQAPAGWWADMLTPKKPNSVSVETPLPATATATATLLSSPDMPGISSEILCTALIEVCRHQLTYEGVRTNAWLVNDVLLTAQQWLFAEIRTYFEDNTDLLVDGRAFNSKTMMDRLRDEQLISERCAAVMNQHEGNFQFSEVIRINPEIIWGESEPRPMSWLTKPFDCMGLRVVESRANRNTKGRRSSLPLLMALLPDQATRPSQVHSAQGLPGFHGVLATYPELAWPELSQAARSTH